MIVGDCSTLPEKPECVPFPRIYGRKSPSRPLPEMQKKGGIARGMTHCVRQSAPPEMA